MKCDKCGGNKDVSQYEHYDLYLCPDCRERFVFRLKMEKQALAELEREQLYLEQIVLPYPYSFPST